MADLIVDSLVKRFGVVTAVNSVSFHVKDGEFFSLLGPSGCGKSTTLAALAGLDRPTEGSITADGNVLFDHRTNRFLPPEARNFGLVFQSYALWPHLTVEQNLEFPLKLRRMAKPERQQRIRETLELVEMADMAERFPHQLSGGQQQRVALARTLVYRPSVLLLDEPLSNLDAKLRDRARVWLSDLQRQLKITTIYVTHDQTEALALSDRIAIMNKGEIVQLGTPSEVYERPSDPFVADFIGTSSFVQGRIKDCVGGQAVIEINGGGELVATIRDTLPAGSNVTVAVRPENMRLSAIEERPGPETGTLLRASILSRSYGGARFQYLVEIGQHTLRTETQATIDGAHVWVWIPAAGALAFPTR
jgi:iron(III) transport system ATP-binding protein